VRAPEKPIVSVVIPTYNRAQWLRRAIMSVLNQTFQDYEIIVVDDGSSDNTQQVENGIRDRRIRYVRHDGNRGASTARNSGIRAARGEYIGFLDDDDEWLPQKLEKQLDKFNFSSANVGAIYTGSSVVSARTGSIIHSFLCHPRGYKDVDFLRTMTFNTSVPLIKRSCFDSVGLFDETLPGSQDMDMWLRIARHYTFAFVPEVLVKRYIHGDQVTSRLKIKIEAKQKIIQKYQSLLSKHPDIMAHHLWRLGVLHCIDGHPAKGRSCFLRAIQWTPAEPKFYKDFFMSFVAPKIHRRLLSDLQGADGISLYY
jgi:glycosyltransferase involved in cell wall biosynthesis